ncbi:MAG TPA: PQQ-binding-like beta-propeller repeat protein [Alphaproteobacteria bacterium]|nr:PQQ-binding-like beta-propeller repeat protein [Alphaproteobacteria bacterium]
MSSRSLVILVALTSFLGACSLFDSEPEKAPLPGERISILDLQEELRPSESKKAQEVIDIPPATNYQDWPQNGGYPHHAMQNLAFGENAQIERIWSADIGAGSSDRLPLNARPVVAAGKVFTIDTKSNVRAFHNQTGKMLWETNVRHQIEKDPVISGGLSYAGNVLYVTSGYNEVLALNPDTGEIYWRTQISAGSRAAPTVYNGRVFVTGLNNNAMALNAKDGKILWEYEGVGETTGLLGAASPAADEDIVVPVFTSGDIAALHVENGSVAWSDSLANSLRLGGMAGLSDIRGLPVMKNGLVIAVSFGGKMAAFDKRNGTLIWQREVSSSETPWVAGNTVYVLSSDYKLMALGLTDGDILWIHDVPKYKNPESRKGLLAWTGPIMVNGRLLLAGTDGEIAEFNPKDGNQMNSWSVKKTIRITPIVADGTMYLISEDGSLLAYR